MRLAIGYPSLDDPRGFHQTGQNRQAQVFTTPAFIYPYIPAMAATLLQRDGHVVLWDDGPAEGLSWVQQLQRLREFQPDLVAWEVKTPSVKGTWERVRGLKEVLPETKVALMGDHVTALPQESLLACPVDYVIVGGDYDFSLQAIVAGQALPGVVEAGTRHDLTALPPVNLELTKWRLYGYEQGSGNYKYLPGTHTMIGRDCWWRHDGGCTFCSWTNTFKNWRVGSVEQFMAEIEQCARLGIREVFDDTGTFPIGSWLEEVCQALRKFNQGQRQGKARVTVGCNMRPGALTADQYRAMGAAGFRFILYGLESANHTTLQRINKGQHEGDIVSSVRLAKRAGLEPHVTCMVGYPWESADDAAHTIALTRRLFAEGSIDTLQATIVIPYPGTRLYEECLTNGWLKYAPGDWAQWDMRRPVMRCPMSDEEVLQLTRGVYKAFLTPQYLARKLVSIRSADDLAFLWRGLRLLWGHLTDFGGAYVH